MRIVLTIPSFVPHGGIRIIMEWANRLSLRGHEVILYCRRDTKAPTWFSLHHKVIISQFESCVSKADILVVCSPHDIGLIKKHRRPERKIIFMQMLEHLFNLTPSWVTKCHQFYGGATPMIAISQWNIDYIKKCYPNKQIHYVGNGVNLDDFPVENPQRDGKTVLVEGWNAQNPTKDVSKLGRAVAARLQKEGYKVLAYSQTPCHGAVGLPDEYYCQPSLNKLNELYRRASILIKASLYDARSCSPMEAMTKGCVPIRAIIKGDDDLIEGENCLRTEYNEQDLYSSAKKVLENGRLHKKLANQGREYVQKFSWDYWMPMIEDVLVNGR